METNEVRINESLSLLVDFNPSLIDELKKNYPNQAEIFRSGIMLGDDKKTTHDKIIDYISNDKLSDAIVELRNNGYSQEEVTIQNGNLIDVERQYRDGVINYDDFKMHKSRIRKALLDITNNKLVNFNDSAVSEQVNRASKENELRLKIVKSSLEVIISKCNSFIPKLKTRLKRLNNIQLISQMIIAVSGASLLITLSNEANISISYLIGVLTLICSLLTLYVQSKSVSMNPHSGSLFKIYDDLVNLHINAEQKLSELVIYSSLNEISDERLPKILSDSNELCIEIRKLIGKV